MDILQSEVCMPVFYYEAVYMTFLVGILSIVAMALCYCLVMGFESVWEPIRFHILRARLVYEYWKQRRALKKYWKL